MMMLARICAAGAALAQLVHGKNSSSAYPLETQTFQYKYSSVAITGGGFITGIIAHPKEQALMYARTDIGSSYRWDGLQDQWVPLTDFISEADVNYLGTETFALDPTDPDRLYLAQGQYTNQNNSAFFVSADRGATFEIYPAPFPMGANELGRNNGERLAVNPFNPSELYMGTRTQGLWKSTDQAATWTNITNYPDASANGIGIVFVLFDPQNEGTIYAGATVPNGLYVTTDGGETWSSLPGQPQDWEGVTTDPEHPPASTGPQPMKAALASNGLLYVTYADFPGPYGVQYGSVWSYNTTSSQWTDITPGAGNSSPAPFTPQTFAPGGYCGLSVDGKDPNTLVVVSLDREPGPALDSMYLSRDGGATWKDVTQLSSPPDTGGYWGHPIEQAALKDGTPVPWLSFNWQKPWGGYGAPSPIVGLAKFGWWITAVLIDPFNSDHVMYGTGATIWSTDNLNRVEADQAPDWYIQAQGIELNAVLAMISPTDGANLYSGLGDISGMRHDNLSVPQPMFGSPGFSNLDGLDWAGNAPNVITRSGASGVSYEDGCGNGAYSTDGGLSWVKFLTCVPGVGTQTWVNGFIAVDASGQYFVWASRSSVAPANASGPYATSDFGKTWTSPQGLDVQTGNLCADKVQPQTFYAFDAGVWYISTDGGASYTSRPASETGLPDGAGAVPVVNFGQAGEVWLPLGSDGLWHTVNFGRTWTAMPGSLTTSQFSVGAPAPGGTGPALFLWGKVATEGAQGLYRSDDSGESWVRINDDAHQYGGPKRIVADTRVYGRVYLGTFGRGMVYADIAGDGSGVLPGTFGI
ncbi:BNR/Asp-box repeat protein [Drepanopeziza brunnea f. sp. 'multigermtubi' MB_m1]|uniref:BNR/Asp-box repeat protein n=1 Tax=Marssonina brunnea f. sp. multigermtubi (strain MB_m1) TaxID=1072389 RepID=K1WVA5_MARBU|nr:BNR/Asp-box repeat protein [Drepanopeziza brunnea f. sp. 'multigermtubi' MB_m1]EKD16397.1 BNR/Asp-box repeat protein [Drepanopeziza brunnea f. sp. 'multigermtubi' MB_m1]